MALEKVEAEKEVLDKSHQFEKEKLERQNESSKIALENQQLELERANTKADEIAALNRAEKEKFNNNHQAELNAIKAKELKDKIKRDRFWGWLKAILATVALLALIAALILALYRFYRWTTEEPLIKEVERKVEVEKIVEKPVEVEKVVEKEVIPDECTQIRRNGKVYVSCDGVTIDGAPTISDSGVDNVPDLITP
ncbi:hypothetical protein JCM19235_1987 [Vibrio maritimus]|uniref:Uncharacterized protein n=1 Tax=Vibrio maritimus TaxID=990268 RepID=A0A090RWI8_9VIBR|nr:hypothetical protein JCM19235_1987 [Vibrio maritimus]